jgi:hypothetical protein
LETTLGRLAKRMLASRSRVRLGRPALERGSANTVILERMGWIRQLAARLPLKILSPLKTLIFNYLQRFQRPSVYQWFIMPKPPVITRLRVKLSALPAVPGVNDSHRLAAISTV